MEKLNRDRVNKTNEYGVINKKESFEMILCVSLSFGPLRSQNDVSKIIKYNKFKKKFYMLSKFW